MSKEKEEKKKNEVSPATVVPPMTPPAPSSSNKQVKEEEEKKKEAPQPKAPSPKNDHEEEEKRRKHRPSGVADAALEQHEKAAKVAKEVQSTAFGGKTVRSAYNLLVEKPMHKLEEMTKPTMQENKTVDHAKQKVAEGITNSFKKLTGDTAEKKDNSITLGPVSEKNQVVTPKKGP